MNIIRRFIHDETAATSIEYGLIAGLISVAIIVSLKLVGMRLSTKFQTVAGNLT